MDRRLTLHNFTFSVSGTPLDFYVVGFDVSISGTNDKKSRKKKETLRKLSFFVPKY